MALCLKQTTTDTPSRVYLGKGRRESFNARTSYLYTYWCAFAPPVKNGFVLKTDAMFASIETYFIKFIDVRFRWYVLFLICNYRWFVSAKTSCFSRFSRMNWIRMNNYDTVVLCRRVFLKAKRTSQRKRNPLEIGKDSQRRYRRDLCVQAVSITCTFKLQSLLRMN